MMKTVWGVIIAGVLLAVSGQSVHADANNFTISRFEADYYLGKDADSRSTLKTVERITAEFPDSDQNHGIERALPATYDGHTTGLKVESVQDENGKNVAYDTSSKSKSTVLRIGDADTYAHGSKTYVITYSQRDVTKKFDGKDEFYWDTNGTQWAQRFGSVMARIHVASNIAGSLNGDVSCYQGAEGSTKQCTVDKDGSEIRAETYQLNPGETMTLAVGFRPTFAAYQQSVWDKFVAFWSISLIVSSIVGFVAIFWLSIVYGRKSDRVRDMGTIIPEYVPPKDISVLVSEKIGKDTRSGITAQIIDLAVRHYIKLYQTSEKSLLHAAEYEIEIIKPIDDLSSEEKAFLEILFGEGSAIVGNRYEMKKMKSNYSLASKFKNAAKDTDTRIKGEYGLREKMAQHSKWFSRVGVALLVLGLLSLSPFVFIAAIVAFVCGAQLKPLTEKGLALRRYLEGLKLYIKVAEQERLKMLQSPEGAEKSGIQSADDPKQLVKLYERVLPYAVLFGQEKEWNKQLGAYYEQNGYEPDWYSGHAAFNAGLFAASINDFTSTTNSYAASTNSSTSGSGGGGYSGGGGGGGGGGGW